MIVSLKENITTERKFFEAERLYLLGRLYSTDYFKSNDLSIELLNKSFKLIENENVTELTWKILIEFADYYSKRGNYSKAKDYIIYTKSVITHIAEKIEDIDLRRIYINSEERKGAIKRLKNLELLTS